MLICSIDLMNGEAVQLRQGKTHVLTATETPHTLAQRFARFGDVAVVDLDAALSNGGDNLALITQLAQVAPIRVGGGIRTVERGRLLLRAGAKKIIIGTAATAEFLSHFAPSQVMVALDVDANGIVLDKGWTASTGETLQARAERLAPYCSGYLCTFVEEEGGLGGLSPERVQALAQRLPHPLTIAGGVSDTANATALCRLGLDVQVGMALYQGLLDPAAVVADTLDFEKAPLIPTIVQDADTLDVLMLAYSSKESLSAALEQGKGIYFSRSRQALWEKGATSGHTQLLLRARYDCDRDTLLFMVRQQGPACHTGAPTCFGEKAFGPATLFTLLKERQSALPEGSYTATLFANPHKLHKKVIEEAFEATQATSPEEQVWELADALFFLCMLAVQQGVSWPQIWSELAGRQR
jgi:phosphoribosyl-ATP pyrophosphohydrolase